MNMISLYILLHVVSAVLWVGGMFFAHVCLRPIVVGQLEPPQRLKLWVGVFGRFFSHCMGSGHHAIDHWLFNDLCNLAKHGGGTYLYSYNDRPGNHYGADIHACVFWAL